jgi:hypothetical protein
MMSIWTIYDHPSDYPDGFIARRHEVARGPTDDMVKADSLEALRQHFVNEGLVCIARDPNDDARIVESWV